MKEIFICFKVGKCYFFFDFKIYILREILCIDYCSVYVLSSVDIIEYCGIC